MAKTASERQAAYRASRPISGDNGERRINQWVSTAAALALRRLSRREGVTQRDMLERLILEADQRVLETLDVKAPEWDDYMGVT